MSPALTAQSPDRTEVVTLNPALPLEAASVAEQAQDLLGRWTSGNVLAENCPSRPVLQHLTSRWGALVMIVLATGTHRFSDLRRRVEGISERMLAQTLHDLQADGFILRVAHPVVPPHVDYSLTPLGQEAAGHVLALTRFVEGALAGILAARPAA